MTSSLSIQTLPVDLIIGVLEYFSVRDILHLSQTCRYYYELLCRVDPRVIWKHLYERDISKYVEPSAIVILSQEEAWVLSQQLIPFGPYDDPPDEVQFANSSPPIGTYSYYQSYQHILNQYRMMCRMAQRSAKQHLVATYLASRGYEKLLTRTNLSDSSAMICSIAIRYKHVHIIGMLPSWALDQALNAAASYGYVDLIEQLIALGVKYFESALSNAAAHGRLHFVNRMIELGATNIDQASEVAASGGHLVIVERMLELGASGRYPYTFNSCFRVAVCGGHRRIAERMLTLGANDYNWAAARASDCDQLEMVKWMIELGADNLSQILNVATWKGHLQIVNFMLEQNIPDLDVAQLLEYATKSGNPEVIARINTLNVNNCPLISTDSATSS